MIYDIEFNAGALMAAKKVLRCAPMAEKKGFARLWKGESNSRSPIVVLSGVAAVTTRIQLGTSVISILAHNPVEAGMFSATLDELSGGRFVLGIGVSNNTLAGWYGATFDKPLAMVEEYVDIVRSVVAREKLSHKGTHYSSNGFRLTFKPQRDRIPIVLAALGPKMCQLAGRVCDGVMTNYANEEAVSFISSNFLEGARSAGREPADLEIITKVRCSVNEDIEKAKTTLKTQMVYHILAEFYRDMFSRMGFAKEVDSVRDAYKTEGYKAAANHVPDAMLDQFSLVPATNVKELKEKIKKYERVKATRISIDYKPCTDDAEGEVMKLIEEW
jgi:alkanesulfonate monooxygenase SsuD/methylene tetrahydromethanopterin reductase-like flavin-dependent oxidoreductase (luciferase family)